MRKGRRFLRSRLVLLQEGADINACMSALHGRGVKSCLAIPLIGGFQCWCDHRGEHRMAVNPDVLAVERDARVDLIRPQDTVRQAAEVIPNGVRIIRAPEAWSVTRGTGLTVAVIDTGIDLNHPDLRGNIAGGINFVNPRRRPLDDNGHGTHVAGTMAARSNGSGVVGVAPDVRLYAVKVLDASGSGSISNVIRGLQWVLDKRIPIVNLSLGIPSGSLALERAVRGAAAAGITLVAAAGNAGGSNSVSYPARYPEVIAVSAVTDEGKLASFSSTGPEIDLAAPGINVLSTVPHNRYGWMSGTSMASPHVAGVIALWSDPGVEDQVTRQAEWHPRRLRRNHGGALHLHREDAPRARAVRAVQSQRRSAGEPEPGPPPVRDASVTGDPADHGRAAGAAVPAEAAGA